MRDDWYITRQGTLYYVDLCKRVRGKHSLMHAHVVWTKCGDKIVDAVFNRIARCQCERITEPENETN